MEILKLEGKMIVSISKVDNGYVVTLIEPAQVQRKPPTDAEIQKTIADMVKGIISFNKGMSEITDGVPGEDWKRNASTTNVNKLVEDFKAMHPGMAAQMKEEICPPQPRIERLVFDTLEKLLHYLAAVL